MELGERLSRPLSRIVATSADAKVVISHGVDGRVLQALYLSNSPENAADFVAPHDAIFQLNAGCVQRLDHLGAA
jgi:hypothetical protein